MGNRSCSFVVFPVPVGLPYPTSKKLDSYKQDVEFESFKQSWLRARHDASKDILEQLSARYVQKQVEKTRNLAKLLDKIQLLTYGRNQRKLYRRFEGFLIHARETIYNEIHIYLVYKTDLFSLQKHFKHENVNLTYVIWPLSSLQ